MSELINNREQQVAQFNERIKILRKLFLDLAEGKNVDEVRKEFVEKVGIVTVEEIAQLEHYGIDENGLTREEMQELYRKHVEVFKDAIEEKGKYERPEEEPGHPVHTFKLENRELEKLIQNRIQPHFKQFIENDNDEIIYKLIEDLNLLSDIDKHFERKEHLIFPYLEKYGIFGPTTHMWRIDDFIRDGIKSVRQKLIHYKGEKQDIINGLNFVIEEVIHMIYREENILFPMALQNFTEDEWIKIANESDEIGFCLLDSVKEFRPKRDHIDGKTISEGFIKLPTGILSLQQLELIFNHLPVDITFIDHNDVCRYFSHGKERIFARTKAVIGRTVQNCHPPKSVHVVEELLADFKAGRKDSEDFWIKYQDMYVLIRYFAVRDEEGNYVGTLEFTQNIAPIQAIEGEKRILS